MKKCLHCGDECNDELTICPKCGAMVDEYIDHKSYMDVYHVNHGKRIRNYKLILWFLLGMFLPYIGFLVSWIMYDGDRDRAKSILLGAIVSTIITTLLPYVISCFIDDKEPPKDNGGQQIKSLIEIYKNL